MGKVARVLYLGGLGRSGTTLLERILGELPGVCTLGEVVHLWQRDIRDGERCGCGEGFSRCEFWTAVGRDAFGGWDRVDVGRVQALQSAVERTRYIPRLASGDFSAAWHAKLTEYAGHYAAVYRAAARVTGARLLVDSSKHSALAHCLRWLSTRSGGIDFRVAHMLRDARGVAYSWTKTVARPEATGVDVMTRYPPIRSALLWNAHNAAFDLLGRCAVPVRRVRYEDLLADPRQTVRELAAFAGLNINANPLHFLAATHVDLHPGHSAAGNPMRFSTGRVPLRADDAWHHALPTPQRRLVGAVCAPLLRRYGYPLRPDPPTNAPAAEPIKPAAGSIKPAAEPIKPATGATKTAAGAAVGDGVRASRK